MKTPRTSRPIPSTRIDKPIVEFLSFLAIGTVIFWVTESLAAGALMPSARAGWRSFRTGWWILVSDRRRLRSLICSAFCFATGFWKGAASAIASIGVFATEYHWTGREPDNAEFIVVLQRLFLGILLTAFIGLVASIFAAVARIRVWVHPLIQEWTRGDFSAVAHLELNNRLNHAMFVLATSLGCPMLLPMYFLLLRPPTAIMLPLVTLGGAFLTIVFYGWFASRIIAARSDECWS